jgi:hypothetical protein
MPSYRNLISRLANAAPSCGYRDIRQLPDLSVADLITVLRHSPEALEGVRLDAACIIQALETAPIERAALRLALHLRTAVEIAARDYLLSELTERAVHQCPEIDPRLALDPIDVPRDASL